jgi:hypothetical protein
MALSCATYSTAVMQVFEGPFDDEQERQLLNTSSTQLGLTAKR